MFFLIIIIADLNYSSSRSSTNVMSVLFLWRVSPTRLDPNASFWACVRLTGKPVGSLAVNRPNAINYNHETPRLHPAVLCPFTEFWAAAAPPFCPHFLLCIFFHLFRLLQACVAKSNDCARRPSKARVGDFVLVHLTLRCLHRLFWFFCTNKNPCTRALFGFWRFSLISLNWANSAFQNDRVFNTGFSSFCLHIRLWVNELFSNCFCLETKYFVIQVLETFLWRCLSTM